MSNGIESDALSVFADAVLPATLGLAGARLTFVLFIAASSTSLKPASNASSAG
jgi:hypothetical protein